MNVISQMKLDLNVKYAEENGEVIEEINITTVEIQEDIELEKKVKMKG